ncbi:MAG: hypothetical protein ACR2RE_02010 [Geminicoccaceae bacterium]
MGASNPSIIAAYEKRITALEQKKLVIAEKLEQKTRANHTFEDLFELALDFLKIPCKLSNSGKLSLQRTVLKLAFSEQISYCRSQGLRTPDLSFPFKVLEAFRMGSWEMARPAGFEPATVGLEGTCSNNHFNGLRHSCPFPTSPEANGFRRKCLKSLPAGSARSNSGC